MKFTESRKKNIQIQYLFKGHEYDFTKYYVFKPISGHHQMITFNILGSTAKANPVTG
jgi:hypothetical protein